MKGLLEQADKKEYKIAEGIINKIIIKKRDGDDLVKFKLGGDDYIQYSLFGEFPFAEGDQIKFKYIIKNGMYYNVKEIIDTDNIHTKPNKEDVNLLKKELSGYDDKTIKTILMRCSVDVCLNRNETKDKEIFACYERFLSVIQ